MPVRAFLALAVSLCAVCAHACSIPVFRYALDRWPADPYALEVSASDAQDEAVGRFLRNFTDSTPLNLVPARLKEDGPSRLVFPHAAPGAVPAWSGALDGTTLPQIIASPARAEIIRRILDGEVGVWLLVESGERGADDRAAAALEKRLRYLEQVAQLPQIDPNDPTSQLGPGPVLRVKFSLLRVARDLADEQPFLKMLAGPKAEGTASAGPWCALVFGRGRVLGAWPVEGFGDEQIDEACLFLLGACSCQVKRLNPGWDLLLNTDWNEALQAIGFPASAAPETVTIGAATPVAPAAADAVWPSLNSPVAVSAIALLVLGGGVVWWSMVRRP